MKTFRVAASVHDTTRELVDDHDLTLTYHIVDIVMHDRVRTKGEPDVVVDGDVFDCEQVVDAEELLGEVDPLVRQEDRFRLHVDRVIVFLFQRTDERIRACVEFCRFLSRSRDDERSTRLIDEDRVDFIDDRVVELALNTVFFIKDHVVTEVVESELVVRRVRDITVVGRLFLDTVHVRHVEADRETECEVERLHEFFISFRQIFVDRYDVYATASERVQVDRKCRDERLPFTGFHFGDVAVMEHIAPDELDTVMTHPEHTLRCLTTDRERLRQEVVKCLAFRQTFTELFRLRLKLFVGQCLDWFGERLDQVGRFLCFFQHSFLWSK